MIFGFVADIEITAEANPTSVETEKLKGFQQAGVNRLSLGVKLLTIKLFTFWEEVIMPMKRSKPLKKHENSLTASQLI